jgi:hypothetical protein
MNDEQSAGATTPSTAQPAARNPPRRWSCRCGAKNPIEIDRCHYCMRYRSDVRSLQWIRNGAIVAALAIGIAFIVGRL